MGQNPYDQNDNPFNQPQDSPFGNQENPFGNQPYGQPYGSGPSGFNQPVEPQRRGNRTCLTIVGLVFICIILCCVGAFALAWTNKPYVAPLFWISQAGTGNIENTAGIVCPNSQAEDYSVSTFPEEFPNVSSINFDSDGITRDGDDIIFRGSITSDNGEEPVTATFVVDLDGEGDLGPFGCVQAINIERE